MLIPCAGNESRTLNIETLISIQCHSSSSSLLPSSSLTIVVVQLIKSQHYHIHNTSVPFQWWNYYYCYYYVIVESLSPYRVLVYRFKYIHLCGMTHCGTMNDVSRITNPWERERGDATLILTLSVMAFAVAVAVAKNVTSLWGLAPRGMMDDEWCSLWFRLPTSKTPTFVIRLAISAALQHVQSVEHTLRRVHRSTTGSKAGSYRGCFWWLVDLFLEIWKSYYRLPRLSHF